MEKIENFSAIITEKVNKYKRAPFSNGEKLNKICVLMDDNVSSFIASKLCANIFGKENVTNIIIPCYNDADYILKPSLFSNDNNIKYKIIGVKYIFDDISESEMVVEKEHVIDFLREKILDVELYATGSIGIMTYHSNEDYTFFVTNGEQLECIGSFNEDEIKDISKTLEL